MQRYFLKTTVAATVGTTFTVSGDVVKHWVKVMRAQPGDQAEFVTLTHAVLVAKLVTTDGQTATATVTAVSHPQVELPLPVTIACGLSKGDKPEQIVQRGTELGASAFVFFDSQWAVAKWAANKRERKLARLAKIAQGAAEQSHRTMIPTVSYAANLQRVVADVPYDRGIVAWEESAKRGESGQLVQTLKQMQPGQRLLAIFGPEGGLTPDEVGQLNAAGIVAAGLGPRIMRAETAPLYLLSSVSFWCELV
ncbi:16S rRNA (uracil(1498)-N(3))-methyltransferase [Lactiplantibacillus garii]|uniref:Ribosomal RNA small subunit methyltransferase E n=1 Tax=Lactiplantibacillus garii TaxID=2306423 RepID=A0A426D629_9LACO|nr:16S rRNA (uracil(1498)-N(3))-methyltransferase [Lactiplantibacillus garii]RRK10050.1 16S rRNA (uracil(1498)-N(3))-methyltransferase [Lactiplantibacillus garii]